MWRRFFLLRQVLTRRGRSRSLTDTQPYQVIQIPPLEKSAIRIPGQHKFLLFPQVQLRIVLPVFFSIRGGKKVPFPSTLLLLFIVAGLDALPYNLRFFGLISHLGDFPGVNVIGKNARGKDKAGGNENCGVFCDLFHFSAPFAGED
jgi:hypothetical protein